MRKSTVFGRMLGVEHTVIEDVDLEVGDDGEDALVVGRRCRGYGAGGGTGTSAR